MYLKTIFLLYRLSLVYRYSIEITALVICFFKKLETWLAMVGVTN